MMYVYYLQSTVNPAKTYVGFIYNVEARLSEHNAGKSIYTAHYKPWKIRAFFAFLHILFNKIILNSDF